MKFLSRFFALALGLVLLTGVASATSVVCPVQTLAFYAANFGPGSGNDCFIGDKHFTDFTAATVNLPGAITVTPHEPIPGLLMGFNFSGFMTFEAVRELHIMYNVSVSPSAPLLRISDVHATIHDFFRTGASSLGGTLAFTEDLCVGGAFSGPIGSPACSGTAVAGAISQFITVNGTYSDTYLLSGLVSSLGVKKSLILTPVGPSGPRRTGFLSLDNDVSQTVIPEPGTLALIGLGLVGLAGLKRSRRK
jgi:hypothetical protein